MFLSVYKDVCNFLQRHFLASIVITITYYAFSRIFVDGVFDHSNPLFGYQFFFYDNFILNILVYSVIVSITFLIIMHFEKYRKINTSNFLKDIKEHAVKFILGGLFLTISIGVVFYISFLLGQMNLEKHHDFIAIIRVVILLFGSILMLKTIILFFPILYFEDNKSITQVFRAAIKRSSWRLVCYYLLFVIVMHWIGLMAYYVFDILSLFKMMTARIEDLIQAYVHVMIMLVQISIYKNITKFE